MGMDSSAWQTLILIGVFFLGVAVGGSWERRSQQKHIGRTG